MGAPGSVTINPPKTPVTKGSSGIAAATLPNVCKMPGPPAPFLPTPLPNIGNSGSSPQGYSTTVTIEGQPVAIAGASFGSSGDVASQATGGGLISSNTQGPTKFIGPGSFNVQIEGKNVQLLGDPMLNNCGPGGAPANAGTMTGVIQKPGAMTVIYGDDQPCGRCGKTHPLGAGKETLEMIRTLTKALKRKFEEQKARIKELNQVEMSRLRRLEERQLLGIGAKSSRTARQDSELFQPDAGLEELELRRNALMAFFKTNALLKWDHKSRTYSRGYMIGVSTCACEHKKLAACSGNAPPAFFAIARASGLNCVSPMLPSTSTPPPKWVCAAKQIMDNLEGHRPIQLVERWFSPFIGGLAPNNGPKISYLVLIEDSATKTLTVEARSERFDAGENVPSCERCQARLPALYCENHCG